jgi:hypothetical protein
MKQKLILNKLFGEQTMPSVLTYSAKFIPTGIVKKEILQ